MRISVFKKSENRFIIHCEDKLLSKSARPTQRAPDAGDFAPFSGSFLRLSLFLVGRLRRPRPSAGNASR